MNNIDILCRDRRTVQDTGSTTDDNELDLPDLECLDEILEISLPGMFGHVGIVPAFDQCASPPADDAE